MNLQGKRVLVTGGSSGIGLATARLLLANNARVIISGRRPDVLDARFLRPKAAIGEAVKDPSAL